MFRIAQSEEAPTLAAHLINSWSDSFRRPIELLPDLLGKKSLL